jgi:hypothetical protein
VHFLWLRFQIIPSQRGTDEIKQSDDKRSRGKYGIAQGKFNAAHEINDLKNNRYPPQSKERADKN